MGRSLRYVVSVRGLEVEVKVAQLPDGRWRVAFEGSTAPPLDVTLFGDAREPLAAIAQRVLELHANGSEVTVGAERRPMRVESRDRRELGRASNIAASGTVRAPMPGRVVKVLVEAGAAVEKGAAVVVVEAMKMENELLAPVSGVVQRVAVQAGDAVERGAPLVEIR